MIAFDSLVRFWLPFTMIYNRHSGTTISIMISSRSGLQWTSMDLFPQTTSFPVAKVGQFFAFRNIYKPTNVLSMLGEFHVSFPGVYMTVVMFHLPFSISAHSQTAAPRYRLVGGRPAFLTVQEAEGEMGLTSVALGGSEALCTMIISSWWFQSQKETPRNGLFFGLPL